MIHTRIFWVVLAGVMMLGLNNNANAWSADGHTAIGVLAMDQLKPDAKDTLQAIVGTLDADAMIKACNWPDAIRETEEWKWTSPRHYVNIPRGETSFEESRDCPDQLCATQAIKKFATGLGNDEATKEQRWQSFAWLCHVVADLHQPLHAGFGDDRGGNSFAVSWHDEDLDLHTFWDHALIETHAGDWQDLVKQMRQLPALPVASTWSPDDVDSWTNESHQLAEQAVYPETIELSDTYVEKSWEIAQRQIRTAASRLALIINSELTAYD